MGHQSGRNRAVIAVGLLGALLFLGCASLPQPANQTQSLLVFTWETDPTIPPAETPTGDSVVVRGETPVQVELGNDSWGYRIVAVPPGVYRLERRITRWRGGATRDQELSGVDPLVVGDAEIHLVPLVMLRQSERSAEAGDGVRAVDAPDRQRAADALRDRASFSRWAGRTVYGFAPFSPFEQYTESQYRVTIETDPPGAVVTINEERWGSAPLVATLAPGKHFISLQLDGFQSEFGYLNVTGDGTSSYRLTPTEAAGREDALRAVVMPFVNIGPSGEDYLSGVISDSLQLALEREGLDVVAYRGAGSAAERVDYGFAESAGARLVVAGDFLSTGEEVLVHAALYDVQREMVKAGLLFNRPGGFEIFDAVDSITEDFSLAVSRVLPDVGKPVVEERRLTGESRAFNERLAERGVVQRRMEYPRALDAGVFYGTLVDPTELEGYSSQRLDGAGPSFGMNVSYDHPIGESISGVLQLGFIYTSPSRDGDGDGGGSWHIPLSIGPRVTFRGYKNDIYVGLLGAWHFATRRTVWGRDKGTGDPISADVGPYWFAMLNLETGVRVYLGDDLSRRPTFLNFGLVLGMAGYRFELDFSDGDPADFEVWLRGGVGVRL